MSEQDNRRNAKLGFFVLIGLIVLLVGIFFIGSARNLFSANVTLYAFFENVEGLQRGNNIWLSGVKIGTVKDVDIVSDTQVLVTMNVRERDQKYINEDARAYLSSEGLVGNAIVVIEPGRGRNHVDDGDTLQTKSIAGTQEIMSLAKRAGEEVLEVAANLAQVTQQLLEGEGAIGMLLRDSTMATDIKATVNNLQATSQRTRQLTSQVTEMVSALQKNRQGPLYTLSNDTTFAPAYTSAISNIQATTANAAEVSRELQQLSQQLQRDDNAVGVLLKDPNFAANLQRTMDNAADASKKLDENMEALQHNFLLRGFFRKRSKREEKALRDSLEQVNRR